MDLRRILIMAAFRLMCVLWGLGAGCSAPRAADDAMPVFAPVAAVRGEIQLRQRVS
jgi:hypothetical protein